MGAISYAIFLYRVSVLWSTGKKNYQQQNLGASEPHLPFFSIIIPARNEAGSIQACIRSIAKQDYPQDKIEIIVVDDHSEDETAERVRALTTSSLRLIQLPPGKTGKKAALNEAIKLAKGEMLLFTDADCTMGREWVKQLSILIAKGGGMILAPVRIQAKSSLLQCFQGLDVCGTILLTGAAVQASHPILANGANLAISKALFHKLDGYTGNTHRASGDDIFLLQKAVQDSTAQIAFAFDQRASVQTPPAETWTELFWQRLRWAGKTGGYTDRYLQLFQALVYLLNLGLLVGLPALIIQGPSSFLLVGAYVTKGLAEYRYLRYAASEVGDPGWMRWFLPSLLLHTVYVVLIGSLALLPVSSRWKGRKV